MSYQKGVELRVFVANLASDGVLKGVGTFEKKTCANSTKKVTNIHTYIFHHVINGFFGTFLLAFAHVFFTKVPTPFKTPSGAKFATKTLSSKSFW